MENKLRLLFVCTANICRSPMAEAVFRQKAANAGLAEFLQADSAATHDYRLGEPPDARAMRVIEQRGYTMSDHRARMVSRADLESFDYVLAMDMKNMSALHRLGEPDLWQKPRLLMPYSRLYTAKEIADPYGGNEEQFEVALDMIESATSGLLAELCAKLQQHGNARNSY